MRQSFRIGDSTLIVDYAAISLMMMNRDGTLNANLWILPTTSAQSKSGELIYDVVNNRGEMKYRVRIPAGRSVAGFGKNGEVYLMFRDAKGWTLERTKLQ